MEYTLKAFIEKTTNPDKSVTLTGIAKYDYVGSMEDVDFTGRMKPLNEIDNVIELIEVDDNINTGVLISSGSLVEVVE